MISKHSLIRTFALTTLAIHISACSGGSGSSNSPELPTDPVTEPMEPVEPTPAPTPIADTVAPTILSTSPASSEADVATDTLVTATYSEAMQSVSSINVKSGTNIPGTASYDSATNTLTFTPDTKLPMFRDVIVTINSDATDLAGNAIAAPYDWQFSTGDGAWDLPITIPTPELSNARGQILHAEAAGEGALSLVYGLTKNGETTSHLHVMSYTPATGWGDATRIDTLDSNARYGHMASNTSGQAVITWDQSEATGLGRIFTRMRDSSGTWGAITRIDAESDMPAWDSKAEIDEAGNAVVVWYDKLAPDYIGSGFASRYTADTGWSAPEKLNADLTETGSDGAQIDLNRAGEGFVVFFEKPTEASGLARVAKVMAKAYHPTTGFGPTVQIANNDDASSGAVVAVNDQGDAVAVWSQGPYSASSTWASRYSIGSGWSVAEELDINEGGTTRGHRIAIDADGNAIAAWMEIGSDGRESLWTNRSSIDGGWLGAEALEQPAEALNLSYLTIAMDADGNGMAAWQQVKDGFFTVRTSRYLRGVGWEAVEALGATGEQTYPSSVNLAFDTDRRGTAIWRVTDPDSARLQSARFE